MKNIKYNFKFDRYIVKDVFQNFFFFFLFANSPSKFSYRFNNMKYEKDKS